MASPRDASTANSSVDLRLGAFGVADRGRQLVSRGALEPERRLPGGTKKLLGLGGGPSEHADLCFRKVVARWGEEAADSGRGRRSLRFLPLGVVAIARGLPVPASGGGEGTEASGRARFLLETCVTASLRGGYNAPVHT